MNKQMYFQELFEKESSTYTYLLADKKSREGVLIDPVDKTLERDKKLIQELGFQLKYIIETHVHADHITSASKLREAFGAQVVLGVHSGARRADILVKEGETLSFGDFIIKAIETPGHTSGCMSYLINKMLFTGDTLLIRSVGRTDFQQGDAKILYKSIQKLYAFSDETLVYPAHNYEGISKTIIGEEKKYNTFIKSDTTEKDFVKVMNERELPLPKRIDESVPANLQCGEVKVK